MKNLFIVRYPEKPICVPEKGKVTIGRAAENTIVLAEPRVSRLHAQIEWREFMKKYVLVDLGSSNGTFLNSGRVNSLHEMALGDRDKIRVASSVMTVRFADDISVISNEFMEFRQRIHCQVTEIIDLKDVKEKKIQIPGHSAAISGDLEHLCPIELFQMLEAGRKTGHLSLTTSIGNGYFNFKNGKIITARFKNIEDEKAVFESLKSTHGRFEFHPLSEIKDKPQISATTSALLMEGCRLMDEALAAL
jgi:pSer/pThr/pTyr-binding forkhead associated (FHA) protein